jgi:hypothetical protein
VRPIQSRGCNGRNRRYPAVGSSDLKGRNLTWHQDSTYWGLSTPDVVTAWVAFTPATEANGAMEYIPGSHKLDQIPHRDTFAKHNLLTRGQEVMVEVDHSRRRVITLRPGEMSLHHVRLVHGSPPNPSNDRRIGFAIRYIPTMVAQLAGEDSAILVRGEDRHHHFALEPWPSRDLDPEFVALHRAVTERNARILYRGGRSQLQRAEGAGGTRLNQHAGPGESRAIGSALVPPEGTGLPFCEAAATGRLNLYQNCAI